MVLAGVKKTDGFVWFNNNVIHEYPWLLYGVRVLMVLSGSTMLMFPGILMVLLGSRRQTILFIAKNIDAQLHV